MIWSCLKHTEKLLRDPFFFLFQFCFVFTPCIFVKCVSLVIMSICCFGTPLFLTQKKVFLFFHSRIYYINDFENSIFCVSPTTDRARGALAQGPHISRGSKIFLNFSSHFAEKQRNEIKIKIKNF